MHPKLGRREYVRSRLKLALKNRLKYLIFKTEEVAHKNDIPLNFFPIKNSMYRRNCGRL
jgi:hypothetical protein